VVFDNYRRGSPKNLAERGSLNDVCLVEGDVRVDSALIAAARGCEVVYHLAAQSNVLGALTDAEYSVTTNVVGTHNVLRAARTAGIRRLVFASSREVYGEPTTLPVPETAPLNAKNPYGASKIAGEAYCTATARTFECQIVRIANVFGPRDTDRVIPIWLQAARNGEDLHLFGGDQVLDFVWVGKAVEALLAASEQPVTGPINIGSGQGTPLNCLAQAILQLAPTHSRLVIEPARSAEVVRFVADVSLMRCHLSVEPEMDPLAHLAEIV
jgi:UDP-glucose 4-epimerase